MKKFCASTISVLSFFAILQANVPAKKMQPKIESTFAMIKPDAVQAGYSGEIIKIIELNGFTIKKLEKTILTNPQAKKFYSAHKGKSFFNELIAYITSGPIIAIALEKENAIDDWRKLIGETNPAKAQVGTLRKMFGKSLTQNAVHGSDSLSNARAEIKFFFSSII